MTLKPLTFSAAALKELDRRAVADFHIPILVLMENAGRAVASAVGALTKPGTGVLIICGPGNNGADGMVAARHLYNASRNVEILTLFDPATAKPDTPMSTQLAIVYAMKIPFRQISADHSELRDWIVDSSPHDVIVDAIFGTGLSRTVEGLPAEVITAVNGAQKTVISVDIPSGLQTDTGQPLGIAIRAAETVSFCGSKMGYKNNAAAAYTGRIIVVDIGMPIQLLRQLATHADA